MKTQVPYPEERVNDFVRRGASVLTTIVAVILLTFVIIALIGVVATIWKPLFQAHDYTEAALEGLDLAFLAIILLELVHTTLSRGPITRQVQEFIAIGITAGVRSGLEIAASSRVGSAREFVISATLNSVGVFVLVVAWWLVRQRLHVEQHVEEIDE